jgi:methylated-DNA-[protein]-cysteine S-methyltransferase
MQTTASTPIVVVDHDSPIGRLTIAMHDGALRALAMEVGDNVFERLLSRSPEGVELGDVGNLEPQHAAIVETITRYFDGDVHAIDTLRVQATGSAFQQRVWDALREIPVGETCSYVQLARTVGAPNASRAVGRANATNPVAIVVPCHRVVRADGALGGYGGGLDRKRWLLQHERAHTGVPAGMLTV